jgi:hypothetical protein
METGCSQELVADRRLTIACFNLKRKPDGSQAAGCDKQNKNTNKSAS